MDTVPFETIQTECLKVIQDLVDSLSEEKPTTVASTFSQNNSNFVYYPSLHEHHASETAHVLYDLLENVCTTTPPPNPTNVLTNMTWTWPVTDGLRYSAVIPNLGPLGFTLNNAYPTEFNNQWVPEITAIGATGAAYGCGKGVVPNGIRNGDYLTHIENTPLIGCNMDRVVELVVASPRPLHVTLCRTLRSTLQTLDDHVRQFKSDATWRGKQRAQAQSKTQELETTIFELEEKNSTLRKYAQEFLLTKRKLEKQVSQLNNQLRKENFGALKSVTASAVAAVARPMQNQHMKMELEATKQRLEVMENQWDRKVAADTKLNDRLPKRFRKMIGKMLRTQMHVNIAAVVNDSDVLRFVEKVSLEIANMPNQVEIDLFGKYGRAVERKDGKSGAFRVYSVRDMERVLEVSLTKNLSVRIHDIDTKFRVEVAEASQGNDIVLQYNEDQRKLTVTCNVVTSELDTGLANLGKQARLA